MLGKEAVPKKNCSSGLELTLSLPTVTPVWGYTVQSHSIGGTQCKATAPQLLDVLSLVLC